MPDKNNKTSFFWRNQSFFIIVTTGATLSLKDFLTFPVLTGEHGGGAFLLFYLLFLVLLGLPLLIAELLLGRISKTNISDSLDDLSSELKASIYWKLIGYLTLVASFFILSAYSVISGWSLSYMVKTLFGVFSAVTADGIAAKFHQFQNDSEAMMLWHSFFMLIIVAIAARPLQQGVEKLVSLFVPLMGVLLVIGLGYALYTSELVQSVEYILYPDFSKIDASTAMLALQRAFFTLALGLGVMTMYGAYSKEDFSLGYAAIQIVAIDLLFSVLTGIAINALIFSTDFQPVIDDELAFRVLPVVFGAMPFGTVFGALFYCLLALAAITTALAIMEALIHFTMRHAGLSRIQAATRLGLAIWFLGLGTIFSYSLWKEAGFTLTLAFGKEAHRVVNEAGFNDVILFLSSNLFQPLIALFIALFVGWIVPRTVSYEHLKMQRRQQYELWNFAIRFVVPTLVFIVLLTTLGLIEV